MTTVTLDLAPDTYHRLSEEAHRRGKPIEPVAEALLAERLAAPTSERERATEVLRAAGLLTEPGPEMKGRAARSTAKLDEVQAALAKGTGKTLSEIVIEQRGPKR
jgi:hypothetical protein